MTIDEQTQKEQAYKNLVALQNDPDSGVFIGVRSVIHSIRNSGGTMPHEEGLTKLMNIAGQMAEVVNRHSACKNKCSMCCNMAVHMTFGEAAIIGSKIGVEPVKDHTVKTAVELLKDIIASEKAIDKYSGVPCPFNGPDGCTIYEHRPIACRTCFNMTDDPRLCDVSTSQSVNRFNAAPIWDAQAFICYTHNDRSGDIREFFPKGKTK